MGRSAPSKPHASAPSGNYVDALLTSSRALVAVSARSLAVIDEDVTLSQYRALVVLGKHGPTNVGTLADSLGIHPSTATRLCDRLLRKRLIERDQSPSNRREVTVSLSLDGALLLKAVTRRRRAELAKIARRIPPEVRRDLVRALEVFAEAAGEVPDDAWKIGWSS
ncbi:MAG: MarR family winged helix-turn-helix transcriptional regulator [Acidimicrobiia bacterium]